MQTEGRELIKKQPDFIKIRYYIKLFDKYGNVFETNYNTCNKFQVHAKKISFKRTNNLHPVCNILSFE